MPKKNQEDLMTAINALPEKLGWLLRKDEEGFFANITSPKFDKTGGAEGMSGNVYAETPVLAIETAYRTYKANCTLHGVDQ